MKTHPDPIDNLRIGTCSWRYDSWRGLIYPQSGAINYLAEYSRHYRTVEIDRWFWSLHSPTSLSLPKKNDVQEYLQSVPGDFTFTIKAPNSLTLTHFPNRSSSAPLQENPHFLSPELFQSFIQQIEPLWPQVQSVMLQFEYLNRQKSSSQDDFLEKLERFVQRIDSPVPIGIEIRNPQYLNRRFFVFLQAYQLHPVFLQGYYMPPIVSIFDSVRDTLKQQVIIRLHGPDRQGMEKASGGIWNRLLVSRDDELQAIAAMVRTCLQDGLQTVINVNNHYEGSAPLTIDKLQTLLAG